MRDNLRSIINRYKAELLSYPNVIAVGQGVKITGGVVTNTPAIVCTVRRKVPIEELEASQIIPAEIKGVVTDVIESPDIVALSLTEKKRPCPPGYSTGHPLVTAGTLGAWVLRQGLGMPVGLSNNHVWANSNDAVEGDSLLQPGKADGGMTYHDEIGELLDFIRISWEDDVGPAPCPYQGAAVGLLNFLARLLRSGSRARPVNLASANLVDAALMMPLSFADIEPAIHGIGIPAGTVEAVIGQEVVKCGRTTEVTEGTVTQINVAVRIGYGGSRIALFDDQIMFSHISEPGDSGSLILDKDKKAVSLLFAGSDQVTIGSRIQNVFDLLNLVGFPGLEWQAKKNDLHFYDEMRQSAVKNLLKIGMETFARFWFPDVFIDMPSENDAPKYDDN